ncbi:hypothetical protein [Nocardia sp. NPDC004750]
MLISDLDVTVRDPAGHSHGTVVAQDLLDRVRPQIRLGGQQFQLVRVVNQ